MIGKRMVMIFLLAGCLGCGSSNPTGSNPDGATSVPDDQYTTQRQTLEYSMYIYIYIERERDAHCVPVNTN